MNDQKVGKSSFSDELEDLKIRSYLFGMLSSEVAGLMRLKFNKPLISRELHQNSAAISVYIQKALCAVNDQEFFYLVRRALNKTTDTQYWLRIIRDSVDVEEDLIDFLWTESVEIVETLLLMHDADQVSDSSIMMRYCEN